MGNARMKKLLAATLVVSLMVGGVNAADWTDNVKVKGDLRYRHEMLDNDNDSVDPRHRQRLRARIGIFGTVSDMTEVGVQLATGSDDPVSTNQTLGDAFSTKNVGIDLAYFTTRHDKLPGLELTGGKFKNPFITPGKSELMWDSDWNPEGGVLSLERVVDNVTIMAVGSGLWIEERSSGDDSWLGAGQAAVQFHLADKTTALKVGGGFYAYQNAKSFAPFHEADDSKGNSFDSVEVDGEYEYVYATGYELLEMFVEVSHQVQSIPVTVIGDFVTNTAADSLETGWLVGAYVGKTKKPGSWALRYLYREVEKDAVVGAFADSDFRGGGTDARGHEFGGSLQLANNTTFSASWFANEIGLEQKITDFSRLQVDLQLKF